MNASERKTVISKYCELVSFTVPEKLVSCAAALSVGAWGLTVGYMKNEAPAWAFLLALPVLAWIAIALPRHFRALRNAPDLQRAKSNPIISTQCTLAALGMIGERSVDNRGMVWLLRGSWIVGITAFFCGFFRF